MEGRKLQLAGKSTFLVSLPKRWVTGAGLKAGDTLFVDTESDGSVSVRTRSGERPQIRRKVFNTRGEETRDHLIRKLIGGYVGGFGLIELRFPPDQGPFVRRVAREFCRLVIGPEVIEETRNSILVQDLSDASELSSEKCLRRMHLTVRTMLEDAVLALRTGEENLAHDVDLRGQDVSRLYWMVAKQYHLAHTANGSATERGSAAVIHGHRLIAKILERIAFHAQRIAGTYPTLGSSKSIDTKLWREIEDARTSAISILDKAFNALITQDIDAANHAIDSRFEHQKMVDALAHRVSSRRGEELLALGSVVDSLGRVAVYSTEIAEETIDLTVLTNPETA